MSLEGAGRRLEDHARRFGRSPKCLWVLGTTAFVDCGDPRRSTDSDLGCWSGRTGAVERERGSHYFSAAPSQNPLDPVQTLTEGARWTVSHAHPDDDASHVSRERKRKGRASVLSSP